MSVPFSLILPAGGKEKRFNTPEFRDRRKSLGPEFRLNLYIFIIVSFNEKNFRLVSTQKCE